ncbi:Ada family regulatory protein/methylated-DNA--protein-cysteine methyltransferase [Trabulsiella guamensis ATCC 49490]|uniref:Regulatory protein of adaptive response n=1 Tax=Trabulsiella guamensis ATCC 49490 TaxID=1005994 RepID=A0A085AFL4_9ENTR|nr:bifunctional DNA-binding transcriptional regulator/O6-methylguanine-DNA methyltransferase Ada [Trabulsiella guamensis]KFC09009.1 Ada family regulatory protein/methylated-DNA--protein-cysteine methyltransferase [Trabulsiella guamensis ATCC 49490]
MKRHTLRTEESRWQAVLDRDPQADGAFVFAVQTTGIFCRPSCRARHALRQNVQFFPDAQAALAAGFRPCKRCQPDKQAPQQQRVEKVAQACRLLEQETPVTLDELARQVGISPFHLHRLFKATTGMTPKAWQQAWRARRLRESLARGETVIESVLAAGFPDSSTYYRAADAALGMTARQYRRGGEDAVIHFATGSSEIGRCLVAESERGVCAVLLGDSESELLAELQQVFPRAQLQSGDAAFQERVNLVIASLNNQHHPLMLPLDIRGTAFQQQVWQALRAIPPGETRSYRQVAASIGKPNAVRAVAGACAANKLAILIPCHRVVREDGALSGYRWGVALKALLLRRESSHEES